MSASSGGPPHSEGGAAATHGNAPADSLAATKPLAGPSLRVPTLPDDSDALSAALAYAKAGWWVVPVTADTKAPTVLGKGWQHKSSRDPQEIASWFAGTDHALGLHVGRSGAVVFDVDAPDKIPDALRQAIAETSPPFQSTRTDEEGRGHYVFRAPRTLGNGRGQLLHPDHGKAWGEVRGTSGIIVASPSRHVKPTGRYEWVSTGQVPPLPGYLDELLPDGQPGKDAATDETVAAFLDRCTGAGNPANMQGPLTKYAESVAAGESRHETAVEVTCWAMREAAEGQYPAREAAEKLRAAFVESLNGDRSRQSEYDGILAWAVAQAPPLPPAPEPVAPMSLDDCHKVYRRWMGESYDLGALDVVLACAAVEQLGGDPVWLLMISGSGNAKTETIGALAGAGATVTSTITSEGALLSATSAKDKAKDATGGLLRKMGPRGLLVIKDFTSILSMNRDQRAAVLAALREVYDGKWERNVGTDGGKTLTWSGRLVVIGATTSAYDSAHAVIAAMGDRFGLVRVDSNVGRLDNGRQALRNVGNEAEMRAELSEAVAGVLAGLDVERAVLDDDVLDELLQAANLVTLARTAVERDFKGDVVDAHQPEAPTRFAKYLGQIVRGGLALGLSKADAMRGARRVAGDSTPPLRLRVLEDVMAHPGSRLSEVQKRLQKPRTTLDRTLQELHILGLLVIDEAVAGMGGGGWMYSLHPDVAPAVLTRLVTRNVTTPWVPGREESEAPPGTDIPGYDVGPLFDGATS